MKLVDFEELFEELEETTLCNETSHGKKYLIIIRAIYGVFSEAELSPIMLYDIIDKPYRQIATEEDIKIWNKIKLENSENPPKTSTCTTHISFCIENMPCFSSHDDPLLNALSSLNIRRGDAFIKALTNGSPKSIYLNEKMFNIPCKMYAPYSEWLGASIFKLSKPTTDYTGITNYFTYRNMEKKANEMFDLIDWQAIPNGTELSSPVLLCTFNVECALFSSLELFNDVFRKMINASEHENTDLLRSLRNKNIPRICHGKDSCKPIMSYINENGDVMYEGTNDPFQKGRLSDLKLILSFLFANVIKESEGFAYEIVKHHSGEKCIRRSRESCMFSGLKNKNISFELKNILLDKIQNKTLFKDYNTELVRYNHIKSMLMSSNQLTLCTDMAANNTTESSRIAEHCAIITIFVIIIACVLLGLAIIGYNINRTGIYYL